MTAAAVRFAGSKNIDVDLEAETGEAGGYATRGRFVVNYKSKGQRQFATAVHEIAHVISHFGDNRKDLSSKDKEIDAESTAFIVMHHFGYEADYSANYLALHKATGKDVKRRKDFIARAVKEIITGIRTQITGNGKSASSGSWYKKAMYNPFVYKGIIMELASEYDHLS